MKIKSNTSNLVVSFAFLVTFLGLVLPELAVATDLKFGQFYSIVTRKTDGRQLLCENKGIEKPLDNCVPYTDQMIRVDEKRYVLVAKNEIEIAPNTDLTAITHGIYWSTDEKGGGGSQCSIRHSKISIRRSIKPGDGFSIIGVGPIRLGYTRESENSPITPGSTEAQVTLKSLTNGNTYKVDCTFGSIKLNSFEQILIEMAKPIDGLAPDFEAVMPM